MKINKSTILLPIVLAMLICVYNIYIHSHNIYNSSQILNTLKEQELLKNIIRSIIAEITTAPTSPNLKQIQANTDEYIKKINESNTDNKSIFLSSHVKKLRDTIIDNTQESNGVSTFITFYIDIINSINQNYITYIDNELLNINTKAYILGLKVMYDDMIEINKNREYIQKAIINKERVYKDNALKWLDFDTLDKHNILFLLNNETQERVNEYTQNANDYKKIINKSQKLHNTIHKLETEWITEDELSSLSIMQREKFIFMLEISNILESELFIHCKEALSKSQLILVIYIFIFTLSTITLFKTSRIIKINQNIIEALNKAKEQLNIKNQKDTPVKSIIRIKQAYDALSEALKNATIYKNIKNDYLSKVLKVTENENEERLQNIAYLRKTALNYEQVRAINMLQESQAKNLANLKTLESVLALESKKLQLNEKVFDPQELFSKALQSVADDITKKEINYITYIDTKINKNLISDSSKIVFILSNLLNCAIYQCNQYSKLSVEIKQKITFLSADVTSIEFIIQNDADTEIAHEPKNKLFSIKDEYVSFWLSIIDIHLKLFKSNLVIQTIKNVGNMFSFELLLKNGDKIEYLKDLNFKKSIAFFEDINKDYNKNVIQTLSDFNIKADIYTNLNQLNTSKSYDMVLTRRISENMLNIPNLIQIKDPITPVKILSYLQSTPSNNNTMFLNSSRPHILVLEDNSINLQIIKHAFEDYNVDIVSIYEYRSLLEITKKRKFDIVLMDTALPNIDTMQIAKQFKANDIGKHTPLIAMLSNTSEISAKDALVVFDDYIKKPYNKLELKRILSSFIPNLQTYLKENNIHIRSKNILLYHKTSLENKIFADAINELDSHLYTAQDINDFSRHLDNTIFGLVFIDDSVKDFNIRRILENIEKSRVMFGVNTKLFIFSNKPQSDFSIKHYVKVLSPNINKTILSSIVKQELQINNKNKLDS
ncbi:hypothetical protein LMG7974_00232 [Campylobacter majalis]|uniref:Response regulatory domain-containing protein n=1 Tax=Campylobacter majalis TaxID=2790656 RepID=A0ABM8Q374_9BACT|nr:hypothetical protein LMG7974_00232 [Campylobacter majalis]